MALKNFWQQVLQESNLLRRVFKIQGQASFGIYLIHPIFLDILRKGELGFRLSFRVGNPLYTIPLSAITAYIASFIIIMIMRKIPFLKWLAP